MSKRDPRLTEILRRRGHEALRLELTSILGCIASEAAETLQHEWDRPADALRELCAEAVFLCRVLYGEGELMEHREEGMDLRPLAWMLVRSAAGLAWMAVPDPVAEGKGFEPRSHDVHAWTFEADALDYFDALGMCWAILDRVEEKTQAAYEAAREAEERA